MIETVERQEQIIGANEDVPEQRGRRFNQD